MGLGCHRHGCRTHSRSRCARLPHEEVVGTLLATKHERGRWVPLYPMVAVLIRGRAQLYRCATSPRLSWNRFTSGSQMTSPARIGRARWMPPMERHLLSAT